MQEYGAIARRLTHSSSIVFPSLIFAYFESIAQARVPMLTTAWRTVRRASRLRSTRFDFLV